MPHRWCNSAELRCNQIESGDDLTFNKIFKPFFIKKVKEINKKNILEVGAGTGHLSKALASEGFRVTAIEPSPGMFKVASDVLKNSNVKLLNHSISDLPADSQFEVVISHLVAHVIDDEIEFFNSVYTHSKAGGHFIFSIPHPCFYNEYKKIFGDEYCYMEPTKKEISFTITLDPDNVISEVPYHHRPLSSYMNSLVKAGFVIEGFEEIWPLFEVQKLYGELWKTPRYCVFECKKL